MRRWWLRALVSFAGVAILLSIVSVDHVWTALREVGPSVWIATVGIFVAGHSMNAMKLRVLVGADAAPAAACLRAHFAGIAANLGLPGVAGGDVVRAAFLAPLAGTARVTVAAVADRIVDLIVLLLIVVVAAVAAPPPPAMTGAVRAAGRWLAIVVVVATVAAVLWRRSRRAAHGSGVRCGGSRLALVREVLGRIAARPEAVALALTISLGVQSVFVLTNVWVASHVGVDAALAPWFLAWTGAKLSAVLPISLGGLGVREGVLVAVLVAYGLPAERVLAVGLLWDGAIIAGSLAGFLATQTIWGPPAGRQPTPTH